MTDTPRRDPTTAGGTVLEQFAKSRHGRELYHLQDDGLQLAETQRALTPFQRDVYLVAKAYWSEQERDEAESKTKTPNASSGTLGKHV